MRYQLEEFSLRRKNIIKNLFLLLILLLFCSGLSHAQPKRSISGPTATGCFRMPVAPLSDAPPLRKDMSEITRMGYLYFDSIMKIFTSNTQIDPLFEQIHYFDTLKKFDALLYAMIDYDPILFKEYLMAGDNVNALYKYSPISLLYRFSERTGSIDVPLKHRYLVHVGMILHIKITAIAQDSDTLASNPVHPVPLLCVSAQVLDTIKGKHFASVDCRHSTPCIDFSFSPLWKFKGDEPSDVTRIAIDKYGDAIFRDSYGDNFLPIGSEYIAFLSPQYLDFDGTYAYYVYEPYGSWGLHGGFLPIDSNHNVQDAQNIFGHGTTVNVNSFISHLRNDIDSVLHP